MKKVILVLFAFIFGALTFAKSIVLDVLWFADLVKNTEYTKYADYEGELNYDTIDAPQDEKLDFLSDEIDFTKKNNLYCTPIYLEGIKDKTLAMMQLEGSGRFPCLRIFRYNKKSKNWTVHFSANGAKGECGLVYPVPDPLRPEHTYFLEIERNFDNKRLTAYNLLFLDANKNKWHKIASACAHYVYNLTDEQKEWISAEIIEKMALFDYSFMGIPEGYPQKIEREIGSRKIVAELYRTSVGYMPSNYSIKIKYGKGVYAIKEGQWGFNIVEKDGKKYLVYIGMGGSGEHRVSTIEDFYLNVLNLDSLENVYHGFVKSEITFVREWE